LDHPGEVSFYSSAWVLRGRVVVDHGAAFPACGRARRGRGSVLRVQASLMAATAWSGEAWLGRVASRQVAAVAGSSSPFTAAAVQGLVVAMSGGVQVASASSTASQRGQGECEAVERRVASGVHARRERHPGLILVRDLRRWLASSSTAAWLGWCRSVRWRVWAPGPV
jgi:hypothetical protein